MTETKEKIKVIYVDDEENNLFSFKATFRMKYEVHTAISASDAITLLDQHPDIAIIITDQRMPNMPVLNFSLLSLINIRFLCAFY